MAYSRTRAAFCCLNRRHDPAGFRPQGPINMAMQAASSEPIIAASVDVTRSRAILSRRVSPGHVGRLPRCLLHSSRWVACFASSQTGSGVFFSASTPCKPAMACRGGPPSPSDCRLSPRRSGRDPHAGTTALPHQGDHPSSLAAVMLLLHGNPVVVAILVIVLRHRAAIGQFPSNSSNGSISPIDRHRQPAARLRSVGCEGSDRDAARGAGTMLVDLPGVPARGCGRWPPDAVAGPAYCLAVPIAASLFVLGFCRRHR